MSFINTGNIPCDTHEYHFLPIDKNGRPISLAENRRLADACFREANDRLRREMEQDKLEQRKRWQKRIACVFPCFVGNELVR